MSLGGSTEGKVTKEHEDNRSETNTKGTQREQLVIEQEAVDRIIQDVLGGADGLASIFAGEQMSGIFNSSVAAQEAGDLAAKLAGEIAKLQAVKETTQDSRSDTFKRRDAFKNEAQLNTEGSFEFG